MNTEDKIFDISNELNKTILARLVAEPGLNGLKAIQIVAGAATLVIMHLVPSSTSAEDREKIYSVALTSMAAGLTAAHKSLSSNDTNRN